MPTFGELSPDLSAFDVAAARLRGAVQPPGGRPEGVTTKILENYLPHMFGGLASLPQRATMAAGDLQRTGEYDAGPAIEAAMLMAGARSPFVKPGEAGIFGGRLAQTADLAARDKAKEMAAAGADARSIWDSTGWFQGKDGAWRFEIPDNQHVVDTAALDTTGRLKRAEQYLAEQGVTHPFPIGNPKTPPALQSEALKFADQTANSRGTIPLKDYLLHDELYSAYPNLGLTPTRQEASAGYLGTFDPNTNVLTTHGGSLIDRARAKDSTVLHEAQHAIQAREGFARGANQETYKTPDNEMWRKLYDGAYLVKNRMLHLGETAKEAAEFIGRAPDMNVAPNVLEELVAKHSATELRDLWKSYDPHEMYRRTAGEVEARNVQTRMGMTPEQRRARPPWETEDVPRDQQIARQGRSFGSLAPR